MVVAAGARDRQAEEGLARDVDLLIGHVEQELLPVLSIVDLAADGEEASRNDRFGPFAVALGGEEVAGHLLRDELVKWLVGVERRDDPVAVAPGLGIKQVCLAARLGEPRDVEPVPPPALAEPGRLEQAVDDPRKRGGRLVGDERRHFPGRRGQAGQVEAGAAQQRMAVGVGDGLNALGLERGQQEAIDVGPGPRGVFDLGAG